MTEATARCIGVCAAAAAMVLGGCGETDQRPCSAGETQTCPCPGGGAGTQTCSGGAWGACTGCDGEGLDGGLDGRIDAPTDAPPEAGGGSPAVESSWSPMPAPEGMTHTLHAVWGSGPGDVYAAGDSGLVLRIDGRKAEAGSWWTPIKPGTGDRIEGLWGVGPNDLFAAAWGGTILRYDGAAWSTTATGTTKAFRSIWGAGFSSVYAGGEFGTLRFNDRSRLPGSWTEVKAGNQESYLSIWGSGPSDVFIAGTAGTILHHDGAGWEAQASGTSEHLWGIWGASAKDVYAVGEGGTVVHYDGAKWSTLTTGTGETLYGVWGSGPNDVFVVGAAGTILRHDGAAFSSQTSGTSFDLRAVWGSGPNDVYAVGEKVTILHFAPCDCRVGDRCYQEGDRDDSGCQICDPARSATALVPFSGDCTIGSSCWSKGELDPTGCKVCDPTRAKDAWSEESGRCAVGGRCHASGAQGPAACQACDPGKDAKGWSQKPGTCIIGGTCYQDGAKDVSGCQTCDTLESTTAWTPVAGTCTIGGSCHKAGVKDSSGCLICDPARSSTSWSSVGGKCLIDGACRDAGAKDSSGCRTCDATKDPSAWTLVSGKCYIGGACHDSGALDSGGCRVCDVGKDALNWTMLPGKCFIDGVCRDDQQQDGTGCNICDVGASTTGWTPVGCTLGKLTPTQITFALGGSSTSRDVSTINTDGTGLAATSLKGLSLQPSSLSGRVAEYYPFSADLSRRLVGQPHSPIRLPKGRGRVYAFRDTPQSQVGVLWVRPDGGVEVLYSVAGTSTSQLSNTFAVSDDGTRVATHRPGKGIVLMRTDGLDFGGGKPSLELDPPTTPDHVHAASVTLTDDHVYMVGRTGSQHTLWAAPTDGSKTALAAVTLPAVGGSPPVFIDDEIAVSPGGTVAVTAGASYSAEDVIAIDKTGAAKNLTQAPDNYKERASSYGYHSSGCQLALSPDGEWVAYARYISYYKVDVHLRRTDGTGTPIHVTSGANFQSGSYLRAHSFRFADNNTLFFYASGSSSYSGDLFMVKLSTGVVTNVSKLGTATTKPYTLSAKASHRTYGVWVSPNRKWLYYLAYATSSSTIRGIEVATGAVKEITPGAHVHTSHGGFASCPGEATLYVAARPNTTSQTYQLMSFNMNTASKAVTLTDIKPPSASSSLYLYDLTPSPDCSHVAFRAGYSSKVDVYSVKPGPPAVVARLTDASQSTTYHYVHSSMRYSKDSKQLVYLHGNSTSKYRMYAHWSTAGPCCKETLVHDGGSSSYKTWVLLGVK